MGLDTSYDAWSGSYIRFHAWRKAVAEAAKFKSFGGLCKLDDTDGDPRLIPLLNHSDCDGTLSPDECKRIADGLEAILSKMKKAGWHEETQRFIKGCRDAVSDNAPIVFL